MNNNSEVINKNAVILDTTGEELNDFTCPFVVPDITIDFSVSIKVKEGSGRCVLGWGATACIV